MSKSAYSRASIMGRLFNQPLAVTSETAAMVLGAVGPRFDVSQLFISDRGADFGIDELRAIASAEVLRLDAASSVEKVAPLQPAGKLSLVYNRVQHIQLRGELVAENDGSVQPSSGFTGYDGIRAQVMAGDNDPQVAGLLLDINTPGGECADLFELADFMMARRGKKPMRAVIRGSGCSAGYTIAATADPGQVTLHPQGLAGSNGVITMHADFSQQMANDGVKVTLITSGLHKGDGNPFEPLPASVQARIQAMVNSSAERLFAHVAKARGMTADEIRAQQAQVYQGEEAVKAGLVDKIMSWQDSMDEFEQQVNGQANRQVAGAPTGARSSKGTNMSIEATAPAADQQPESNEAAISAARAEGHAAGVTAGATAEQGRILALAELDRGTTLSESFTDAVNTGASAGDFAISQINASKAKAGAALSNLQADAVSADDLPESGAPAAVAPGAKGKVNRGAAYAASKVAKTKA